MYSIHLTHTLQPIYPVCVFSISCNIVSRVQRLPFAFLTFISFVKNRVSVLPFGSQPIFKPICYILVALSPHWSCIISRHTSDCFTRRWTPFQERLFAIGDSDEGFCFPPETQNWESITRFSRCNYERNCYFGGYRGNNVCLPSCINADISCSLAWKG